MLSLSEPVTVRLLRGPTRETVPCFGMLLDRPEIGHRLVVLLAPRGRMKTSRIVRVLESDAGGLFVETQNSLYLVRASAPHQAREAV